MVSCGGRMSQEVDGLASAYSDLPRLPSDVVFSMLTDIGVEFVFLLYLVSLYSL